MISRRFLVLTLGGALALTVCLVRLAMAADAGDPNLIIRQGSTFGNLGVGTASPNRPITIQALSNGVNAVSVKNAGNTSEVFTMTVTAQGFGLLAVKNASNTQTIRLTGDPSANSFITGGVKLGIGLTNPQSLLHVNGEAKFVDAIVNNNLSVASNATVTGQTTTGVLQITGGADLAETFDVRAAEGRAIEPGMLVCIDPANPGALTISRNAYDRTVAGVISGAGGLRPGMRMGQAGTAAEGGHPIALTGRVYCWADATGSAIAPGDLLTTSDRPGHAMRATDHDRAQGAIIGKAMTALEADTTGLVMVLISLQ